MTSSTLFILSLTLIALCASLSSGSTDIDALIALKQSLTDPDHNLDSWDPYMVDPCTWLHVTCNDDNRVIRVDLGLKNLGGVIAPEIGNIDTLQNLELFKNNIQGTIPPELGNLSNLLSLDLYNNQISGTIPPSLGNLKQLLFLRLSDNPLMTGTVPPEVSSLPNLRILDVSNTGIQGPPSTKRASNKKQHLA